MSKSDYDSLHPKWRGGIRRYIEGRVRPGSFLSAVLENDLKQAVRCADSESMSMLPELVDWLWSNAPARCWGNETNVFCWIGELDWPSWISAQVALESALRSGVDGMALAELLKHVRREGSITDGIDSFIK